MTRQITEEPEDKSAPENISRRTFVQSAGTGALLLGLGGIGTSSAADAKGLPSAGLPKLKEAGPGVIAMAGGILHAGTVVADPTRIPPPIHRRHSVHHNVTLEAREVRAQLSDGTELLYMTWNGQVPGPMIRVRQGDTVTVTIKNPKTNTRPHNVDMHAVYGTGGGSAATTVDPGQSRKEFFRCMYPGAFIYHCAVPNLDEHISLGMYGMIVVEPLEGLPRVDREFYIGQNEVYTKESFDSRGEAHFDYVSMAAENPSYVLFNGAVDALTSGRFGDMQAMRDETVRVFMVNGGPNLTSSFHAIGNVWKECWPQGALANAPQQYVQTQSVPPGSCFVGQMALPVPETIKLVDHALSRVARKGLLAKIHVGGTPNPAVYKALG